MVGIFYAAPLLGPSLGPLLGGVLAQAFDWRASMWLLAAILGVDLVLFALFFRDTFRCERSLTYRRALARRQSAAVARTVRDTINSREKGALGDGPTSPSSACGAAAELDLQAKITPSLADVDPFPPLFLILRCRNNITTLFPSGTTHASPPLPSTARSCAHSRSRFALRIWLFHRIHVLSDAHRRV
jgi:MFS family permease